MLSSQMCNSDNLILQQQRTAELNSLFLFLIESCVNHSSSDEQRSLAQFIEPLFNTAVEINPLTYSFLTSPFSSSKIQQERNRIVPKKEEVLKSKKTKVSINRHKSKIASSASTSKESRLLGVSISNNTGKTYLPSPNANVQDDVIQRLLKAIELSADDLTTILLSRLLQGYVTYCKIELSQRRLRRMVRVDAVNYCLRAMRLQLADANPSPLKILAVDTLAKTLMSISVKDCKLMLKVRLSGLLSSLANRVLEADRLFTTVTLLQLTSRCLRSPRNAQLIGKEKRFAERFVLLLNTLSANMDYSSLFLSGAASSSTSNASMRKISFGYDVPSVSSLLQKTPENDGFVSAQKMARLIEILFFAAKNIFYKEHNKIQLLDNQAVCVLKTIFENHFERRNIDTIHLEIALIALATIRQFSKTKKGKQQLKDLLVLEMCKKYITFLIEDKERFADRLKTLALYSQLQDSLCALCLRCLPQVSFPISKQSFPLFYQLAIKNSQLQENKVVVKQRSMSLEKQKSQKLKSSFKQDSINIEESISSDEANYEEEEDSLLYFPSNGLSSFNLPENNETDVIYSDEDEDFNISNSNNLKLDSVYDAVNYYRQSPSTLKSSYQQHFIELEQDAIATGDSSPKLRKITLTQNTNPFNNTSLTEPFLKQNNIISLARKTTSVGKFVKIAHPELYLQDDYEVERQLLLPSTDSMREMVMNELSKSRFQNSFKRRVVFDLDFLVMNKKNDGNFTINNDDFSQIGHMDPNCLHLKFESRFESGNLRKAIQVSERHYELILSPDINQLHSHYQWFYFQVSNNEADKIYTFEIINCLKSSSMFSRGMQPVLYSVSEAANGKPMWVRAASSVCYYRNLYINDESINNVNNGKLLKSTLNSSNSTRKPSKTKSDSKKQEHEAKNYFSIRFTLKFQHSADVCYIAYHFPYTYSYLNATLERLILNVEKNSNIYIRNDFLTNSVSGNSIPLITITGTGSLREIKQREIVIFSARVHPGESNSSWIMHGILKFLVSDSPTAAKARELFVFKIIPMLNPDGVVNGSHRCSLAGVDLNRTWNNPSPELHPTIYHTKGIVQYLTDITKKNAFVFVDLHGHSRKANIFLYGNNPEESWRQLDHSIKHNYQFLVLPEILDKIAPGFSLKDCRFSITKGKEFSARVALWRQFGLERVYTMEATYCGFDTPYLNGKQIQIHDLTDMGVKLCEAVVLLKDHLDNNKVNSYKSIEISEEINSPSTSNLCNLSSKNSLNLLNNSSISTLKLLGTQIQTLKKQTKE